MTATATDYVMTISTDDDEDDYYSDTYSLGCGFRLTATNCA
jgi:hypothetical protein